MPFKKTDEKKDFSLPGLIDIIFLLLIFTLVTLSVSNAELDNQEEGDQIAGEVDLPYAESSLTVESDATLSTLLFQVVKLNSKDPESPNVVYTLVPVYGDTTSITEAFNKAVQDSLFAVYPSDFLELDDNAFIQLEASQLIRNTIQEYKNNFFQQPGWSNAVEIRAAKEIEFRIIQYILDRCSVYGDTIPQIVLHTLTGEDINYAIF